MPKTTPVPESEKQAIRRIKELHPEKSGRQIAQLVGYHQKTVNEILREVPRTVVKVSEPPHHEEIRKLLKKGPATTEHLAKALDSPVKLVRQAIKEMKDKGVLLLTTIDGKHDLGDSVLLEPGKSEVRGDKGEWTHVFGFTTDNHLCNRHSRLDVLNAAYDHFEREGINIVYNAGNWIDGEARFNKTELITAPGLITNLIT